MSFFGTLESTLASTCSSGRAIISWILASAPRALITELYAPKACSRGPTKKNKRITNVTRLAMSVSPEATLSPPTPITTMKAMFKDSWAIGATIALNDAILTPWS